MDARLLKLEALCWLRFGRRMPIVCTEAGLWSADVLGVSESMAVEVEVKVSKADFQREFRTKSAKHWLYSNSSGNENVPNYFYFLVPKSLQQEVTPILVDSAPKMGLALFTGEGIVGQRIEIAKKPTRLHTGRPSPRMIRTAIARMSSELCGVKQAMDALQYRLIEKVDRMVFDVVKEASRTTGVLDCEDPGDLEKRAAKLAFCVEGKLWCDVGDKEKWIEATKRWLDGRWEE